MTLLRSLLFVPGDCERKLAKASTTSADALIFDLADSVAPSRAGVARELVRAQLLSAADRVQQLWVRVNSPSSAGFSADVAAIADAAPNGLVLPNVRCVREVLDVDHYLSSVERRADLQVGSIRLIVIATGTPQSMFALGEYWEVAHRLEGLAWGSEDLSAALRATSKFEEDGSLSFTFSLARSLCLLASAAAGVQAIDGVCANFRDSAALGREAAAARDDGFTGKIAIHPDQVEIINAAFTPSAQEIHRARRIVAAFSASPSLGVVSLDGCMFDRPHLMQARRTLALAQRASAAHATAVSR
jgi:citrate lyase subunit beta / citryl-CoA lyase